MSDRNESGADGKSGLFIDDLVILSIPPGDGSHDTTIATVSIVM